MGYTASFFDSVLKDDGTYTVTYGRDDINAVAQNIVGAGIAPFPSKDTYTTSELNELTAAIVRKGTEMTGLSVKLSDGVVHIGQGIGYFANGATVSVDADGVDLEYEVSSNTRYVAAEFNSTLNICTFSVIDACPTDSDGIYNLCLAAITAGEVTDKRTFATMKVASDAPHVIQYADVDIPYTGTTKEAGALLYSLPIISSSFRHIDIKLYVDNTLWCVSGVNLVADTKYSCSSGSLGSMGSVGSGGSMRINTSRNNETDVAYKIEGGYLNFYQIGNDNSGSQSTLKVTLS